MRQDRLESIQSGDTVLSVLSRHGFSLATRDRLFGTSGMPEDFRLFAKERYVVSKRTRSNVTEVRFFEPLTDRSYVFWRSAKGETGAELQVIPLETRIKEITGRVAGSILGSILHFIPNNWVASHFMDAYALDLQATRDVQKGARFGLRVEEKYWKGQFLKYGEILKTSLEMDGRIHDRHFVRFGTTGVFVDEQLRGQRRPLYSPVQYMRVSSPFQTKRFHPVRRFLKPHLGTDFELAQGTPIYAAQKGRIARMGRDRASGFYVVIDHAQGFESSYSHLSELPKTLKVGVGVRAGEKIGQAGCTGYCTMPHLHFGVKRYGNYIDPLHVIKSYPYQFENKVLEEVLELRKSVALKD